MNSSAWVEQAHSVMLVVGFLTIVKFLLIPAIYFYIYRKGIASRVFNWRANGKERNSGNLIAVKIARGLITIISLLVPFIVINLIARGLMLWATAYYESTAPEWLSWIAGNAFPISMHLLIMVGIVGFYAGLDTLSRWSLSKEVARAKFIKRPCDNKIARFVARVEKKVKIARTMWDGTKAGRSINYIYRFIVHLREDAAGSYFYRLFCHSVVISGLLIVMQILFGLVQQAGARLEPVPDSTRKQAILMLARDAGISDLNLQIRQAVDRTLPMNASGINEEHGAQIEFSDSLWAGLNDEELLAVVGHELYHVKFHNLYLLLAASLIGIGFVICLIIGRPTRLDNNPRHRNFVTRIPLYALVFAMAYPVFQVSVNAMKRQHEAEADIYSLHLTVARGIPPETLNLALIKLCQNNMRDPKPFWLFKYLLYDHPSLEERLSNITEAAKQLPVKVTVP